MESTASTMIVIPAKNDLRALLPCSGAADFAADGACAAIGQVLILVYFAFESLGMKISRLTRKALQF
jgi:hypothetical protein